MARVPNVANLVAAFEALSSVPERNFMLGRNFGYPFKITDTGKCNTICNAAGWIAQHPHFKAQGMTFEEGVFGDCVPTYYKEDSKNIYRMVGFSALSYLLGIDMLLCLRIFSHYSYACPETVTPKMVCRRLKTTITKAGGKEALKALLKAQKPPKVKVPAKKKAKKAKKKAKTSKKAEKSPILTQITQ